MAKTGSATSAGAGLRGNAVVRAAETRQGSVVRRTFVRRSVTLDTDVDALAHELVGDANFSAFINTAAREKVQQIQMDRLLDDLDAEFGAIDDATKAKAEELWQAASRSTRVR